MADKQKRSITVTLQPDVKASTSALQGFLNNLKLTTKVAVEIDPNSIQNIQNAVKGIKLDAVSLGLGGSGSNANLAQVLKQMGRFGRDSQKYAKEVQKLTDNYNTQNSNLKAKKDELKALKQSNKQELLNTQETIKQKKAANEKYKKDTEKTLSDIEKTIKNHNDKLKSYQKEKAPYEKENAKQEKAIGKIKKASDKEIKTLEAELKNQEQAYSKYEKQKANLENRLNSKKAEEQRKILENKKTAANKKAEDLKANQEKYLARSEAAKTDATKTKYKERSDKYLKQYNDQIKLVDELNKAETEYDKNIKSKLTDVNKNLEQTGKIIQEQKTSITNAKNAAKEQIETNQTIIDNNKKLIDESNKKIKPVEDEIKAQQDLLAQTKATSEAKIKANEEEIASSEKLLKSTENQFAKQEKQKKKEVEAAKESVAKAKNDLEATKTAQSLNKYANSQLDYLEQQRSKQNQELISAQDKNTEETNKRFDQLLSKQEAQEKAAKKQREVDEEDRKNKQEEQKRLAQKAALQKKLDEAVEQQEKTLKQRREAREKEEATRQKQEEQKRSAQKAALQKELDEEVKQQEKTLKQRREAREKQRKVEEKEAEKQAKLQAIEDEKNRKIQLQKDYEDSKTSLSTAQQERNKTQKEYDAAVENLKLKREAFKVAQQEQKLAKESFNAKKEAQKAETQSNKEADANLKTTFKDSDEYAATRKQIKKATAEFNDAQATLRKYQTRLTRQNADVEKKVQAFNSASVAAEMRGATGSWADQMGQVYDWQANAQAKLNSNNNAYGTEAFNKTAQSIKLVDEALKAADGNMDMFWNNLAASSMQAFGANGTLQNLRDLGAVTKTFTNDVKYNNLSGTIKNDTIRKEYAKNNALIEKYNNSQLTEAQIEAFDDLKKKNSVMGKVVDQLDRGATSAGQAYKQLGESERLQGQSIKDLMASVKDSSAKADNSTKDLIITEQERSTRIEKLRRIQEQANTALDKYGKASKKDESKADYNTIKNIRDRAASNITALRDGGTQLSKSDVDTDISKLSSGYLNAGANIRAAGNDLQTFGGHISTLVKKFSSWYVSTQLVLKGLQTVQSMYQNVVNLDTAMTELKKVTDGTDQQYSQFMNNAKERTNKVGASLTEVVNATADFARLGYSIEDASTISDAALIYKNVGDDVETIEKSSDIIISTMRGFGMNTADEAMNIVDKFNILGKLLPKDTVMYWG